MKRRAALAAMVAGACGPALAEDGRALRIVVPVPPGGSLDAAARLIAHRWHARGTPAYVENKPGASMLIGADFVGRAPADGRTLLYGSTTLAIAPALHKSAFAPESLVPVIQLSTESFGLAVRKGSGIESVRDLAELAVRRPAGIDCLAVPGAPEVGCEQLKAYLGGRAEVIPYPGLAPATQALMGGTGHAIFSPMPTLLPLLRAGQVQLLAVSSRAGLPGDLHAAPLLSQAWRGFVLDGFTGIFAPEGTPADRIALLNQELNAILREPEVVTAMAANAQAPVGGDAEVLAETFRQARKRYEEVLVRLKLVAR